MSDTTKMAILTLVLVWGIIFAMTAAAQDEVFITQPFLARPFETQTIVVNPRWGKPLRHIGENEANQIRRRNYNLMRGYTQRQRQVQEVTPIVVCRPIMGGGQSCHSY
jgi:hypothetical protein